MGLKDQVFGDEGFSRDMKLNRDDLSVLREMVNEHWLSHISKHYPHLEQELQICGIDDYHLFSEKIDHSIWSKLSRCLTKSSVQKIKQLNFYSKLKEEFGDFRISDVIDSRQYYGEEEIYWRIVRPNFETDVGELHADRWFHEMSNNGLGIFSEDEITVKVWIPIYCEKGRSGLKIVPGSHKKNISYRLIDVRGQKKPSLVEMNDDIKANLIDTGPGDVLIFHENTLHGGVINTGNKTRVSIEITMVMARENYE